MVNYGKDYGKLVVIVNVINGSYALVTGPTSTFFSTSSQPEKLSFKRRKVNFKRLTITDIKIKIAVDQKDRIVIERWTEEDVVKQWKEAGLFKKIDLKEKRSNMNDFQRFKVKFAQKERAKLIRNLVKSN